MGVVEEALGTEDQLIGTRVLPPDPVEATAGQYPKLKIASANMLRNEAKRRGRTATYARLTRAWESDTYTTLEYGLESPVSDPDQADVGRFFDLQSTEARLTQRQLLLGHEVRVAAKIFDPSVFSLTTSATAYTDANLATFDLAYDMDLAKNEIRKRGESVNPADLVVVMSNDIYLRARQSTRLQNRIRGVLSQDTQLVLSAADLAMALGVREVLVANAVIDSSKQGASSPTLGNIWSNTYCWIGQAKTGNILSGGVGRTLFWKQNGSLVTVESYREEQTRSTIIRVRHDTDEKIANANAGQLLVSQYS